MDSPRQSLANPIISTNSVGLHDAVRQELSIPPERMRLAEAHRHRRCSVCGLQPAGEVTQQNGEFLPATNSPAAPVSPYRSAVNFAHLAVGPLHRIFGRHALDGLGIHVDNDVLGEHFGSLASRRARMAIDTPEPGCDAVGGHYRILLPHLVVLP